MCLSVIEFPLHSAALYVVGIGSSLAPWIDGMVAGAGVGVGGGGGPCARKGEGCGIAGSCFKF